MWKTIEDMKRDEEANRQRSGVYVFGATVQDAYPDMSADLAAALGVLISERLPIWLRDIRFWEYDQYKPLVVEATRSYLRYIINDLSDRRVRAMVLTDGRVRAEFERLFETELKYAEHRRVEQSRRKGVMGKRR